MLCAMLVFNVLSSKLTNSTIYVVLHSRLHILSFSPVTKVRLFQQEQVVFHSGSVGAFIPTRKKPLADYGVIPLGGRQNPGNDGATGGPVSSYWSARA